jgi:hypothetical protein
MPFKPHPDNPDLVIYTPNEYWIPKPWVGLTGEEIKGILDCGRGGLIDIKKAEQILKEKNHGSV